MSLLTGFLFLLFSGSIVAKPTDGLQNYQLLSYLPLQISMSLDKEELSKGPPNCRENDIQAIDFTAYSRNFSLRLQKVCQTVEEDEELLSSGDFLEIDDMTKTITYFQGYLEGEKNSTVDGTIENGVFEGVIISEDHQKFLVERLNPSINGAHSLIFHVQKKEEIIATLFAENLASGELPTDLINEGSGTLH